MLGLVSTWTTWNWIWFELLCVLALAEFGPLSDFTARKWVHMASGFMMLYLDPADWLARYFVYSVVVSSLVMVWEIGPLPFKFRYAKARDVGITVYLLIVAAFFYTQTSLWIIMPVFFADPAGAVVGKFLTKHMGHSINFRWNGEKTIFGTLAVFAVAFLTLTYGEIREKLLLAGVIAFAEGLSKDYDNLLIAGVVLIGYTWVEGKQPFQLPAQRIEL